MPRYDFTCGAETCGRLFEHYLPLDRYHERPPCPDCGADTTRAYLPAGVITASDPVVVFKAPDGSYRFPGDGNGLSASEYKAQGYDRVELRGWAEVRAFEQKVNKREYADICQRMERVSEAREEGSRRRAEVFRHGMQQGFEMPEMDDRGRATGRTKRVHLTAVGRRLMAAAHARNEARPRPKSHEPGFHVEAFSYDRSSRETSRDPQGRRRRD